MPISQSHSVLSEIIDDKRIPDKSLRYFRRLLEDRFHEMILRAFIDQEQKEGLTQKKLANRIGRAPEVVNRWLNTASNYELDTISDLLLGMKVDLDEPSYTTLEELQSLPDRRPKAPGAAARSGKGRNARATLDNQNVQLELNLVTNRCSGGNENPMTALPLGAAQKTPQPNGKGAKIIQFPIQRALGQIESFQMGVANAG